jgi:hypothetical protein
LQGHTVLVDQEVMAVMDHTEVDIESTQESIIDHIWHHDTTIMAEL